MHWVHRINKGTGEPLADLYEEGKTHWVDFVFTENGKWWNMMGASTPYDTMEEAMAVAQAIHIFRGKT